jgi:hypothetical protein
MAKAGYTCPPVPPPVKIYLIIISLLLLLSLKIYVQAWILSNELFLKFVILKKGYPMDSLYK